MSEEVGEKTRKKWALLIGAGLALLPIHNLWLTELLTNTQGETLIFLPVLGYLLLFMGAGLFVLHNWESVKAAGLGEKQVWIPLLVIVATMGLSGIAADGIAAGIAPLGAGLLLFTLYVAARSLGKDIFLPLAVGAVVASAGIIAHQALDPGQVTGGFIFDQNYNIAAGYVLLGAALLYNPWQWAIALMAVLAILLSGAGIGVVAVGAIGLVLLLRRDWSRKLWITAAVVIVVGTVFFASGVGQNVHRVTAWAVTGNPELMPEGRRTDRGTLFERRWGSIEKAMTDIKPLGEGYILTAFQKVDMVHNVPLVIIQQLGWPGIAAAAGWLWVSLWCLAKKKLKYVWVLILSLSLFDHLVWTQLAPVWWMVVGLSTRNAVTEDHLRLRYSDLLFRKDQA